ncbi:VWA domain-containing protein, partial [candidate division KSB1 bacterium]|nr:VWA domain-containing protein [candidate division KSB1 bacterium]
SYRVCLAYQNWFSADTAVVCDTFLVKSNSFRPDLTPRLDRLELAQPRSPNRPITITGIVKNIGGRAITASDSFATLLTFKNLSLPQPDSTQIRKQAWSGPLLANALDSLAFQLEWMPPDTGVYQIGFTVDGDSQIFESHEADSTYIYNNWCFQRVTVRYQAPEVTITHILTRGQINRGGVSMQGAFPEALFSYVNVVDQNNLPVHGLADSLRWLASDETTNVHVPFNTLWQPLKEYHRYAPQIPANPALPLPIRATEITAAQRPDLESARLSLGILMENSLAMANHLTAMQQSARDLVAQFAPNDEAAILLYARNTQLVQGLTTDQTQLTAVINQVKTEASGFALTDAIYTGLQQLAPAAGRKFLVIYTAGGIDSSFHSSLEVREMALRFNTAIYILDGHTTGDTTCANLATVTGGKYYAITKWSSLNAMVQDVLKRMNNFYILVHASTDPQPNGEWRTVDFTLNYAHRRSGDTGYYIPPITGLDLWVNLTAATDSVDGNTRFTKPGATYAYTLTFGNNGYETEPQSGLRVELPNSLQATQNFSLSPASQTPTELLWTLDSLKFGASHAIRFEATVKSEMPPYYSSLIARAQISPIQLTDAVPGNNQEVDTVFVNPGVWLPPTIRATPAEVPVNDPVVFSVNTPTPLKSWHIWIEYPVTSALGVDKSEYDDRIVNKTTPLLPMLPEAALTLEPAFTNTKIWKAAGGTQEQREVYRVLLSYTDQFERSGIAADTFSVYARYDFWLEKNAFNPDQDRPLEITYLLVQDQPIKFSIYNVAGELVRTLLNAEQRAGIHTLHWDGRDENQRFVGSDVYIIMLDAGAYQPWRKVIVVR